MNATFECVLRRPVLFSVTYVRLVDTVTKKHPKKEKQGKDMLSGHMMKTYLYFCLFVCLRFWVSVAPPF